MDFIEWPSPTRPGQPLHVTAEVVEVLPAPSGRHGDVVVRVTAVDTGGKTVLVEQARAVVKGRFPNSEQGFVEVEGGRVWYQRVGRGPGTPLVLLHGGPGGSHFGMQPLAEALQHERPVILYDQLGCGKSDRPDDPALWTTERFVRELAALREALGLDEVHLLGQSWGTMLLADYLLTKPAGVKSAIFSSPCLSALRWVEDANAYRAQLPDDVQQTLQACEANGTTDSDAYEQAAEVYMRRHVCRIEPTPFQRSRSKAAFGKAVYETMWGPSEFYPTGSLKTYDRTDRLPDISIPSLFTCGRFDEAAPASTAYYHSLVPGSEFHVFENSSHSALREEPEAYIGVVRDFLRRVDAR
ncbi:MAG: proline iminopeptidase-family hydrolase [Alicyclobacillus sp.]|nr:proline iminopeptidase-family hydrolase [Alicyclobacillus sp.]